MESIVLQPLLQVVFEKLITLFYTNISTVVNFKKDRKKLEDQLLLIQGVIQDAEVRQMLDERIRVWLCKLQSTAYDADDLLDRIHTEWELRRLRERNTLNPMVYFISRLVPSFDSLNTYLEMKDIQGAIGSLVSEIPLLNLRNEVRYRRYETFERPQTGFFVNASEVVGRADNERMIVQMLLSPSSESGSSVSRSVGVPVLPIVGMGGIGKTTLAQLVYKNPNIEKHFDLRIWIAVGENFNVRKLIRDILEYTGQKDVYGSHLPQLGLMQSRLQESLNGQKYLLVLDDVWNEDEAEWSKLLGPLSCSGVGGSKIVVTTRSQTVAMLMGTTNASFYALDPLTHDACWTLFQPCAFPNGGEDTYPVLAEIGRDIVKKCGGIPLAAKVLGSLLRSNRDEREWRNVLTSEVWELRDNTILLVLRLTYNHLPPNQKRCFLYCSVFPKNYEIIREKLIHQWIAEGLIPSAGDKMEDIANEYFNDLVSMSLFEGVSYSEDGRIAEFRVHNLIHDLALSVYKPVLEKSGHDEIFICRAERRAYIVCNELSHATSKRLGIEKLRILQLVSRGNDFTEVVRSLLKSNRHLRVLNLSNCGITTLHKSVRKLIYLRYLDLSNNPIRRLPETICLLIKLQSLNLSGCRALEELPKKIINLENLRHLNIEDCVSLSWMPPNIGRLRDLQTLSIFIVELAREKNIGQLKHLNLQGKLKIKYCENIFDSYLHYSEFRNVQLHTLSLSWGDDNEGKVERNTHRQNVQENHGDTTDKFLRFFCSNSFLRFLLINGYSGTMFPWRPYDLTDLTKLVLLNCRRCETLPALGQLQFLKYLQMEGMDDLVQISCEFYGEEAKTKKFPCLDELILKGFPKLRTWESMESLEVFPCLRKLSLLKCPRLVSIPWFPILKHLEMLECNDWILKPVSELNSLSTLVIDVCPEAYFIPKALLSNNSHLTSLTISSWPRLTSFPASIRTLTALESLSICFCEALESLPTEILYLTSLETLVIRQCSGLISLPDKNMQGLKSLRSLSIENCLSLDFLPLSLGDLTALEHLTIMYCPNLVNLPDVMQEFRALRSLSVVNLTGLETLPSGLEHVSSLLNLEIRSCPKLQELPDWIGNLVSLRSLAISDCENIKFLPDGLQRLRELQHLSITDCEDLEIRCREATGEDWNKISHIRFRYVGTLSHGEPSASSSSS